MSICKIFINVITDNLELVFRKLLDRPKEGAFSDFNSIA